MYCIVSSEICNYFITITQLCTSVRLTEVDIFLPKFKLSYKSELVNVLQKKGLTNLFQNGDFSRISDDEELEVSVHLQAVLLRPSVGFPLGEVGEAPGLVVQPPPAALQVLVSSAQEYRVVEVWVSWKVKMEVK